MLDGVAGLGDSSPGLTQDSCWWHRALQLPLLWKRPAPHPPNTGQIAAFFSVLGPPQDPCLSIRFVYPLALRLSLWRRKVGRQCPIPFHAFILPPLSAGPLPPQPALALMLCSRTLVWCLILCPAPGPQFSLGLQLAAITAHSGPPGWMQVGDFGGRPAGARFMVLRPARA